MEALEEDMEVLEEDMEARKAREVLGEGMRRLGRRRYWEEDAINVAVT